jgi:hypothetical protein
MPPLHAWETFYVIVGSSAAALTGLQFVVIALGDRSRNPGSPETVAAFGTPTVIHFCSVLTLAAIVAVPGHTPGSLAFCLALAGALGVAYALATAIRARRQTGYEPVFEDWLWHAGLPIASYGTLFVTGICAYIHPVAALYFVAATSLLLLFIGIHNAWDAAVYISTRRAEGE